MLLSHSWKQQVLILSFCLIGLGFLILYGINAGGLLNGISPSELETVNQIKSFPNPLTNLINWPYYLAVYCLNALIDDPLLAGRLISAVMGLVAGGLFLSILKYHFSTLLAILGLALFSLNSWVLHLARSATPEMMSIALGLALVLVLILIKNKVYGLRLKIIGLGLITLAWFTPLMPLAITGLSLLTFIRSPTFKKYLNFKFKIGLLMTIIILSGLTLIAIINQSENLQLIGIPATFQSLDGHLNQLLQTISGLVYQAAYAPERYLGRLPFLDVLGIVLLIFSVNGFKILNFKALYKVIGMSLVLLLIIGGLNQGLLTPGLTLILPLIIWSCVCGLNVLSKYWKDLFPRNQLAQLFQVTILITLVGLSCNFQLQRYFIAFANAPSTQKIYDLENP